VARSISVESALMKTNHDDNSAARFSRQSVLLCMGHPIVGRLSTKIVSCTRPAPQIAQCSSGRHHQSQPSAAIRYVR
jgi:hypothetical protein